MEVELTKRFRTMNQKERERLIARLRKELTARPEIMFAYLNGSFAIASR